MNVVQDQLQVVINLITDYCDKIKKDIRALEDATKKGDKWGYGMLTGIQTDMAYLNTFIEHYQILKLVLADMQDNGDFT